MICNTHTQCKWAQYKLNNLSNDRDFHSILVYILNYLRFCLIRIPKFSFDWSYFYVVSMLPSFILSARDYITSIVYCPCHGHMGINESTYESCFIVCPNVHTHLVYSCLSCVWIWLTMLLFWFSHLAMPSAHISDYGFNAFSFFHVSEWNRLCKKSCSSTRTKATSNYRSPKWITISRPKNYRHQIGHLCVIVCWCTQRSAQRVFFSLSTNGKDT